MRMHVLICLLILMLPLPATYSALAQTKTSQDGGYAPDYLAAKKLRQALKVNDRKAVAKLIDYPLFRQIPLKPISSRKDFLAHWEEYFNVKITTDLIEAEPGEAGWRGVEMLNGSIWFNEGKISAINVQSNAGQKALKDAIALDGAGLFPSARGYDQLEYVCKTKNHTIRVEKFGEDLTYFSWKGRASLADKPELEIKGGQIDYQGSGGNHDIIFKNNAFTYTLRVVRICGEDCNDEISVSKGDAVLSTEVCNGGVKPLTDLLRSPK